MKIRPLKIGKLKIETPLILAPMCDVTCSAYRLLCREFGAGLTFSEKLEEAKFRMDRESFDDFIKEERPVGAQVIGNNIAGLKSLIGSIENRVDVIDFNAGCSKKMYLKRHVGGWFSSHPEELGGIISKLRGATDLPLTVKVRLGSNRQSPEIFHTLSACEDAGADAISIHARFVMHNYVERADWGIIRQAKEKANIPVILNGDVFSASDAARAFEETGCDGVMIGRGAIGNPFIFSDAIHALSGKEVPSEHPLSGRLLAYSKFLSYYKKYSPVQSFSAIKAHAIWFAVAAPGTRQLRVQIQEARNEEELFRVLGRTVINLPKEYILCPSSSLSTKPLKAQSSPCATKPFSASASRKKALFST